MNLKESSQVRPEVFVTSDTGGACKGRTVGMIEYIPILLVISIYILQDDIASCFHIQQIASLIWYILVFCYNIYTLHTNTVIKTYTCAYTYCTQSDGICRHLSRNIASFKAPAPGWPLRATSPAAPCGAVGSASERPAPGGSETQVVELHCHSQKKVVKHKKQQTAAISGGVGVFWPGMHHR